MHIVIAVLSAVAGLIWALVALRKSGFNPDSLNPFLWYRRYQWRKKSGGKPIYTLDKPMDVAAVLILGIAKCEGEISTQQKKFIRSIFQNEFNLDSNEADDLLLASAHLIKDEIYLLDNLPKILEPSARHFTLEQIDSLLEFMHRISKLESEPNLEQKKLIAAVAAYFNQHRDKAGKWL